MDNYQNEINNSILQNALNKIKQDQRFKPACCSIIGPTGPTGPAGGPTGATHT